MKAIWQQLNYHAYGIPEAIAVVVLCGVAATGFNLLLIVTTHLITGAH